MIIELPENFSYPDDARCKMAWVKDGILYIKKIADYDQVMYSLTYEIKGDTRCYYCGGELSKDKKTLDHKYPKSFGGPTITNNLVPACKNCNTEKSSLNSEEYLIFRELSKTDKKKFLNDAFDKKEEIRRTIGFDFPQEYVSMLHVCEIKPTYFRYSKMKTHKYIISMEIDHQYNDYGTFFKPIITDANLYLLEGYTVYSYAKEHNINEVPVIILENVEVI